METTQKVGKDGRVSIPSTVRQVMNIETDDVVIIDVIKVVKKVVKKAKEQTGDKTNEVEQ